MSPQKTSEFVKAWSEYRRSGGMGDIRAFSKLWKDKMSCKNDKSSEVSPAQQPITRDSSGKQD